MFSPSRAIRDRFLNFAGELRFPKLLALTVAIFLADLVVPDLIPFVDEILLGLFAALLAMIRKKRRGTIDVPAAVLPDAAQERIEKR